MLWIPGPTEVRPEILAECSHPAIGHRSPAMRELIERSVAAQLDGDGVLAAVRSEATNIARPCAGT